MTFFERQDIGRVYVIRMHLPGDVVVHKIGMTSSPRSLDRMMEILRSWFTKYRFIPYSELKLDMKCNNPARLEEHIHKALFWNQFVPNEKVEGRTEMFTDVDEFRLLHYLRSFNESNLEKPLNLTDEDYKNLNRLLVPNG